MPADPFLAIGMVSAPQNFERRRSVRRDMLDLPSIRDGVLVFRFLLGQVNSSSEPFHFGSLEELRAEVRQPDVVLLDTLDGSGDKANKQCSCLEKTVAWMQFALVQWPGASFYGKTEDDAYVQLRSLELELRRLHLEGRRHLVYGSINICAMPSTPHAVVGYQGAWLGRLENFKTAQAMRRSVANSLRRSTQAQPGAGCQQPGFQSGRAALASLAPLPFATGDLQVMDGELSRAVFGHCLYLKTFHEAGRQANRRSGCRPDGPDFARSWATLTCDCALGRVVAECAKERGIRPTYAHMTQTKSHNYAEGAGYTTASAPSRLSIVVHALKFHDTWLTGPNHTRGGEWAHTHTTALHWRRKNEDDPGFPAMLWQYDPLAQLNESMLEPVDGDRQRWYSAACHPRRSALRARAEALVTSVKGPRPSGSSDAAFLGGQVAHWTGHGCHPSRGYAYPRYPELASPPRDLDIGPHDYRVTSFNNRADGAVAFDWETPSA